MKTIEIKVYQFNELSPDAKEKARQWWRDSETEYVWASDALKSLSALAEHFNGRLSDYNIAWDNSSYSDATFAMPEMSAVEIKTRMAKLGDYNKRTGRGHGDCKLTGYCADEDAIDGFRKAFKEGERDLEKLMQSAFKTWLKAAQADVEFQNADEQVDATIEANEYTFTAEGKRFVEPRELQTA
jgi:hypothetical protein